MTSNISVEMPRIYWEWIEAQLRAEAEDLEEVLVPLIGYDEDTEREAVQEMANTIREALENNV
jgi:NAD(P)H-dependent FMN reductase